MVHYYPAVCIDFDTSIRIYRCSSKDNEIYLSTWHPVKWFKLLRNFGHIISHIEVNYSLTASLRRVHHEFEKYLVGYCSKSLKCLYLCRFFVESEPFEDVISAETFAFSNLESLSMTLEDLAKLSIRNIAFPMLTHLKLFDCNIDDSENKYFEIIKLNPQLKKLYFDGLPLSVAMNMQRFENNLTSLESLTIYPCVLKRNESTDFEPIHMKGVLEFYIDFYDTSTRSNWWTITPDITVQTSMKIPFTFDKLHHFGTSQINQKNLDFIRENKYLKSIGLFYCCQGTDVQTLFKIESVLLNVETMTLFLNDPISPNIIVDFLAENQSLKRLTLSFPSLEDPDYEQFMWSLSKCTQSLSMNINRYEITDIIDFHCETQLTIQRIE